MLTKNFDYWKSRGVPGPRPCLPWGNEFGPPFTKVGEFDSWLYHKHGGKKYCGYFELRKPVLFVGDLEMIKAITIKDFDHFTDQRDQLGNDLFKEMLIILKGAKWKETRSVMSPTFSASKLKAMYQLTLDNAQNLLKYINAQQVDKGEVEIKEAFGKFTMDNIAASAFGINCNSFTDPNSKFAAMSASLSDFDPLSMLQFIVQGVSAKLAALIPTPVDKAGEFFRSAVLKTISHREKNPSSTRDFLQLLMDTKDKDGKRILSDSSIVAQSILFLFAGYETTATLLTFAAYCLALDQEIQQRVQQEVDDAVERHGGLTYEAVMDMPYLDRVISETLRLYSPAPRTERVCTKKYTLPGSDLVIDVGTLLAIPVLPIHRDPEYYPDPLRFDPDRFLPEEKEKRHPCSYLPFGSGPRNCIAMRFALFEAKVALVTMLRELTLKPTPQTPPHPMPLDKKAFLVSPEGGRVPLCAVRRE
ncbi:Cytochrome P450 9e2 [Amphibalanus amphitrite]|uniref:Cytochrome P450 9e2 n=2 Tax=Amphibalanus amphitrite TaxID=1232801 RepID=A0A6A4WRQ8_AMPAM|nr:Cytochrome P450 9e2 [Amphibalanus amphitrite]